MKNNSKLIVVTGKILQRFYLLMQKYTHANAIVVNEFHKLDKMKSKAP